MIQVGKGNESAFDTARIRLLTQDNQSEVYSFSDRVKVNNAMVRGDSLANLSKNQLITFETDNENKIISLNTATINNNPLQYDEHNFSLDLNNTFYFKTSQPPTLGNSVLNTEIKLNSNTIVFDVSDNDSEEWGVYDHTFFANDERYMVEIYDNDRLKRASVVVNKGCLNEDIDRGVAWGASSLLIEKIIHALNAEGIPSYKIYGYENGERVVRFLENEQVCDEEGNNLLRTLPSGSVVQSRYKNDGTVKMIRLLYNSDSIYQNEQIWNGSENQISLYTAFTVCEDVDEDVLTITFDDGTTSKSLSTGQAKYYIYDRKLGRAEEGSWRDIYPRGAFGIGASKLFVRVERNNVREIVIYR